MSTYGVHDVGELGDLLLDEQVDQAVTDRFHVSGVRSFQESLAVLGDDDHGPAFVGGVGFAAEQAGFSSWATW
ncbi:hypothetical protein [Nonomuraea turcica]|uniref:hypothetical protein n=1 Tax=Nonomuraea sp. G32 TaxID=3067274 RepID=UPI00273C6616|nr:hypothetical protein [Nonomuraea sp. G32]MDP4511017.1 hypothetical protein [Nonomuraea sp. G32]